MSFRGRISVANVASELASKVNCSERPCRKDTLQLYVMQKSTTRSLTELIPALRQAGLRRIIFILTDRITEERPLFGHFEGFHFNGLEVLLESESPGCITVSPSEPLEQLIERLSLLRHGGNISFCST